MTRLQAFSHDTFRSLRTRNFRLFFVGQLISQTGTWLSMVTQTLLVLHLTSSGVALGLLTAFQFGPMLVLGAWAGAVADRADKRRLLITVQTLSMLQSFTLGAVVLSGHASVGTIYALAAVHGVLNAFDNPARRSFVVEMVSDDDLPNAVSLNSAVMTGSRVFGPALAGALVVTVGYGWPFVIDGLSYVAVIAGLVLMRPAELNRTVPMARARGQVREGLRYIRSEPVLFVPLVMMAIIGTLAFNFSVTVPLLVERPAARRQHHLHRAVLGGQPGFAGRGPGHGPTHRGVAPPPGGGGGHLRGVHAGAGRCPQPAGGVRHRVRGDGPRVDLVPHLVHGHRAAAGRPRVPRPGARHPGHGLPGHHPDRRPTGGLGGRHRRPTGRHRPGRGGLPGGRGLRRPSPRCGRGATPTPAGPLPDRVSLAD